MNDDAGSIEQALSGGDVHKRLRVWEDFNRAETWREVSATGSGQARVAAAQFLAKVSEVAALEVLRANVKAVELLTARRRYVIKSAREAGATWTQIGDALGITKQPAHHFYPTEDRRAGKYLPDLHDGGAAYAVLKEAKED
jgi:hypothetical protein